MNSKTIDSPTKQEIPNPQISQNENISFTSEVPNSQEPIDGDPNLLIDQVEETVNENAAEINVVQNTSRRSLEDRKGLRKYYGIILALIASVILPTGGIIVKELLFEKENYNQSDKILRNDPIVISVWRFQGILLPSFIIIIYYRVVKKELIFDTIFPLSAPGKLKYIGFLVLRSCLGTTALTLLFCSLQFIALADATVISSSSPIFVTLVAYIFIGEKCGIFPIISGVIALIGVTVISRPPILTGEKGFDTHTLYGAALALGCMLMATLSFVLLRHLKPIHFSVITLFFGLWGTVQTLLLCLIFSPFKFPQRTGDWILALALVPVTLIGQICMTLAFKFEQAGTIALVRTTDLIFAFLWEFAILGRIPDKFSVIGASIIGVGILLAGLRKYIEELPEENEKRKKLSWLLK